MNSYKALLCILDFLIQKLRLTLLIILLFYSLPLKAETIYFYGGAAGQQDLQEIIRQNPPGEQENIKSTLLYKNEGSSVHLIQIRFKERPHIHKTHDLIVILKSGKGVLNVGGEKISMSEGDTAFIPKGVVHYFENSLENVAVGLGIFIPPYDGTDMVVVEEKSP